MAKAKKCIYNGLKFDSLTERDFYIFLKEKEGKGEIFNLEIQKNFLLQSGFKMDNGESIQKISYTCDQCYKDGEGRTHIVDVKGSEMTIKEPFRIRFKMLKNLHRDYIYHIVIHYDGKWIDLESKEDKKLYKELKALKKKQREINKAKKKK